MTQLLRRIGVGGALILSIWLVSFGIMLAKTVPVSGDGIYYFVQLESIVRDQDVDYANNLERFRENPHVAKQLDSGVVTPTGRTPNLFSIGPALMWLPVYLPMVLVAPSYDLYAPSIATSLWVLVGLMALFATLRRLGFGDRTAGLAVAATYLGTNLVYYATFEASMSHGVGFAAVSALLYLVVSLMKAEGSPTGRKMWLLLGLVAGLTVAIRWQLLLAVLPLLTLAVWQARDVASERADGAKRMFSLVSGAVIGFLPQIVVWKALYGSYLVIPQGGGFILPTSPHFGEVLVSARHGLLTWAPLVVLAILGLLIAAPAKNTHLRLVALAATILLFLQTYINGSLLEWWGGDAFGPRRFTDIAAIFAIGLAALFSATIFAKKSRWHTLMRMGTLLLVAALVAGNLTLMQLYRRDQITRSGAVHPADVVEALSH